jgi:hypothetical protein
VTAPGRPAVFVKRYRDSAKRHIAELNYQWLADLGRPLRVPRLLWAEGQFMGFEFVQGQHASPADLVPLARHLGAIHAAAHATELRHARLDAPFTTATGHQIPGFPDRRETALARELATHRVPGPTLTISQAHVLLRRACAGPAAFYKDANPRNFLITPSGPVTVDFDQLTLAPFGYDLAKLVVTLAMTHGALPGPQITEAIRAYNTAARHPRAGRLTWAEFMAWAETHRILTSRYLGHHGYQHDWHNVRPADPAGPCCKQDLNPRSRRP